MLKHTQIIKQIVAGLVFASSVVLSGCSGPALHYESYFVSIDKVSNESRDNKHENILLFDSIKIDRTISKQSFTLYQNTLTDTVLKRRYIDSVNNNNYLTINLLVPFQIKSNFMVKDLNVDVLRRGHAGFDKQLKLLSVFVSDLKKFHNPYYYKGKKFSDFDSVIVQKGYNSNNVLMAATYDLSSITDTSFVVFTRMKLIVDGKTKHVSDYDTVTQIVKVSKQTSIRAH
jgi:hypothetical protein